MNVMLTMSHGYTVVIDFNNPCSHKRAVHFLKQDSNTTCVAPTIKKNVFNPKFKLSNTACAYKDSFSSFYQILAKALLHLERSIDIKN